MCVFVRGEREEKRGGSLFLFAFKERKKEHGGEERERKIWEEFGEGKIMIKI